MFIKRQVNTFDQYIYYPCIEKISSALQQEFLLSSIKGSNPLHACVFVPRFRESMGTLNLIRPSVCPSVCLSQKL